MQAGRHAASVREEGERETVESIDDEFISTWQQPCWPFPALLRLEQSSPSSSAAAAAHYNDIIINNIIISTAATKLGERKRRSQACIEHSNGWKLSVRHRRHCPLPPPAHHHHSTLTSFIHFLTNIVFIRYDYLLLCVCAYRL